MRDRERRARHDANRPSARQRGYDSRWQRERAAFLAVNRHCRRCGERATLVDHIRPHRGNWAVFWDRSNWQPLCTACHSRHKQAVEKREAL
jgi:5-methylcytosine-specific restriction endonuclease McrA